jgi:hypothetical protein
LAREGVPVKSRVILRLSVQELGDFRVINWVNRVLVSIVSFGENVTQVTKLFRHMNSFK